MISPKETLSPRVGFENRVFFYFFYNDRNVLRGALMSSDMCACDQRALQDTRIADYGAFWDFRLIFGTSVNVYECGIHWVTFETLISFLSPMRPCGLHRGYLSPSFGTGTIMFAP